MYYKACPDDNEYAHPMDLCPIVDLNEQRVSRHRQMSMCVSGTRLCCRPLPASWVAAYRILWDPAHRSTLRVT